MAATKVKSDLLCNVPFVIETAIYNTLVAGATVTHSHRGPKGVEPAFVIAEVTDRPTSRDPVFMVRDRSADDTTNDTIALQFDTIPGGDLTGAEVRVIMIWIKQASGGIS